MQRALRVRLKISALCSNRAVTFSAFEIRSLKKKVGQCRLWTPARLTELEEGHPDSRGIPPSASTYCIKMPHGRPERNGFLI